MDLEDDPGQGRSGINPLYEDDEDCEEGSVMGSGCPRGMSHRGQTSAAFPCFIESQVCTMDDLIPAKSLALVAHHFSYRKNRGVSWLYLGGV